MNGIETSFFLLLLLFTAFFQCLLSLFDTIYASTIIQAHTLHYNKAKQIANIINTFVNGMPYASFTCMGAVCSTMYVQYVELCWLFFFCLCNNIKYNGSHAHHFSLHSIIHLAMLVRYSQSIIRKLHSLHLNYRSKANFIARYFKKIHFFFCSLVRSILANSVEVQCCFCIRIHGPIKWFNCAKNGVKLQKPQKRCELTKNLFAFIGKWIHVNASVVVVFLEELNEK